MVERSEASLKNVIYPIFMFSPVDEIKSRLDIVEVIREYVPLKQAGANWKALCPFHSEKTPSFMVSQEKQIWHCFGCGEGGDAFSFVQRIENVEFPEALRMLAQKAHVVLRRQDPKLHNKKSRLLDMHEAAANFFHKKLFAPEGEQARAYLKKRGLDKETATQWRIGFADEKWDSLLGFLRKQGYSQDEVLLSGLAAQGDQRQRVYDRFRARIMFPLADHYGQTVGFSGRVLDDDAQAAKYVNSPQTVIFDKSRVLFGLSFAKQPIKESGFAVLVEGQMDVIASHVAGTKQAVATSGTALTPQQLSLLKRYADAIIVAYDQDSAGMRALERSISLALRHGFEVKVALLPSGEDPDSLIRKSPTTWRDHISDAVNYIEYYFGKITSAYDLRTVQGKKQAAKTILPVLAVLPDKVEQDVYLQRLSELLDVSREALHASLPTEKNKGSQRVAPSPAKPFSLSAEQRRKMTAERLLACLFSEPKLIAGVIEGAPLEYWHEGVEKELYKQLIMYYTQHGEQAALASDSSWYREFESYLRASENPQLEEEAQRVYVLADDLSNQKLDIQKEIQHLATMIMREYLHTRIADLQTNISLVEKKEKGGESDGLMKELHTVIQQLSQLEHHS